MIQSQVIALCLVNQNQFLTLFFLDAFTSEGIFGMKDKVIESKEPFYVEAKLPVEVTVGDVMEIPVSIVNESTEKLNVSLNHNVPISLIPSKDSKFKDSFQLPSKERTKKYLELSVDQAHTGAKFGLSASAGVFSDQVTRKLDIVPSGFPFDVTFSGKLEKDEDFVFTIPKDADFESIETSMKFYLKAVGQLQSALASLLRNPSGCFEQTSSVRNQQKFLIKFHFRQHIQLSLLINILYHMMVLIQNLSKNPMIF